MRERHLIHLDSAVSLSPSLGTTLIDWMYLHVL